MTAPVMTAPPDFILLPVKGLVCISGHSPWFICYHCRLYLGPHTPPLQHFKAERKRALERDADNCEISAHHMKFEGVTQQCLEAGFTWVDQGRTWWRGDTQSKLAQVVAAMLSNPQITKEMAYALIRPETSLRNHGEPLMRLLGYEGWLKALQSNPAAPLWLLESPEDLFVQMIFRR